MRATARAVLDALRGLSLAARVGLAAALLAGAALRLAYPNDIEWKYDEAWMTTAALRGAHGGPVPALGMVSGRGLRNPGLSVWSFVALAKVTHAAGPVRLARAVQALNVLAVAVVAGLALGLVRREEREPWLWAAALAAVNPLAVQLHRKIWAQSLLPAPCALFLVAWLRRDRLAGALAWGFVGALLGQVHMSGFFLAAAVALWTLVAERRGTATRRTRWRPWLAGSAVGALGLLPWLAYLASPAGREAGRASAANLLVPLAWLHWVEDPLGVYLGFSLGPDFRAFALQPVALAAHGVEAAAGLVLLVLALRALPRTRAGWSAALLGDGSESALVTRAAAVGFCLLLTLSGVVVARHYLLVTFPLEWVWLVQVALAGALAWRRPALARAALVALAAAHLAISVSFLRWIHVRGGADRGDYGMSLARQREVRALLDRQRAP